MFRRTLRFRSPWNLLALLAGMGLGCDAPGRPHEDDQYVPPHKVLSFDKLFKSNCAGCHGTDGTLGPAPPLNDKLFLAVVPDEELSRVIATGRPGTLMPAFATGGNLTDEQVKILADGLKRHWGAPGQKSDALPAYLLTQGGQAEASDRVKDRGLKAFARACACCHGDKGEGGQYGGDAGGRPVGAINDPDFLALTSDQALRRYVITGRPDLGMPDYAHADGRPADFSPLSSQEIAAIVALLADWRQPHEIVKGN
jgi:cytochrome c oxidase cbb3-type subunit 3